MSPDRDIQGMALAVTLGKRETDDVGTVAHLNLNPRRISPRVTLNGSVCKTEFDSTHYPSGIINLCLDSLRPEWTRRTINGFEVNYHSELKASNSLHI